MKIQRTVNLVITAAVFTLTVVSVVIIGLALAVDALIGLLVGGTVSLVFVVLAYLDVDLRSFKCIARRTGWKPDTPPCLWRSSHWSYSPPFVRPQPLSVVDGRKGASRET